MATEFIDAGESGYQKFAIVIPNKATIYLIILPFNLTFYAIHLTDDYMHAVM